MDILDYIEHKDACQKNDHKRGILHIREPDCTCGLEQARADYAAMKANNTRDTDLLNAIADKLGLPAGSNLQRILEVLDKKAPE